MPENRLDQRFGHPKSYNVNQETLNPNPPSLTLTEYYYSAKQLRTISCIFTVATLLATFGCAKPKHHEMTEEESLKRYGKTPATAEGIASVIDDQNRIQGRKDTTDYAQAYETSVTEATILLSVLKALDSGDTKRAKEMLVMSLNTHTGFLPESQKRAKIPEKQLHEARAIAHDYLDYLTQHTNAIVIGRVDFGMAFNGLSKLLDDPVDLERLVRLLRSLDSNQSKQPN